jgi:acetyl esterase/lipase
MMSTHRPIRSTTCTLPAARVGAGTLFPYRSDRAVNRSIAGVGCRIIEADRAPSAVYLHFHGGGMSLASPELNDDENERLADELGLTVVSVENRLAPEHPYPAESTSRITCRFHGVFSSGVIRDHQSPSARSKRSDAEFMQ